MLVKCVEAAFTLGATHTLGLYCKAVRFSGLQRCNAQEAKSKVQSSIHDLRSICKVSLAVSCLTIFGESRSYQRYGAV